jgi:hypothetical protein
MRRKMPGQDPVGHAAGKMRCDRGAKLAKALIAFPTYDVLAFASYLDADLVERVAVLLIASDAGDILPCDMGD